MYILNSIFFHIASNAYFTISLHSTIHIIYICTDEKGIRLRGRMYTERHQVKVIKATISY